MPPNGAGQFYVGGERFFVSPPVLAHMPRFSALNAGGFVDRDPIAFETVLCWARGGPPDACLRAPPTLHWLTRVAHDAEAYGAEPLAVYWREVAALLRAQEAVEAAGKV